MSDAAPELNVREALRLGTARLHEQVDAMLPLSRPAPSLDDYREHLRLLLQWTRTLPRLPALAARLDRQAAVLQADLDKCTQLLGADRHGAATAFEGDPDKRQRDAAFGWGMAYVIEGSHLGGQVLYRRLAAPLAPHPLDYLRGSGTATGVRWTAFLAELRGHVRTPQELAKACEGAVEAFQLLIDCHRSAVGAAQ